MKKQNINSFCSLKLKTKGGIRINVIEPTFGERIDHNLLKWHNKIFSQDIGVDIFFPGILKITFDRKSKLIGRKKPRKTEILDNKKTLSASTIISHFPWESMFRDGKDVYYDDQVKNVKCIRHKAWHRWIESHLWTDICEKKHPRDTFLEIIEYIQGIKKCSDEEAMLLNTMVGFDWRTRRSEAIISIFNQFMPDELYNLVKPFYEAFGIE